MEPGDHRLCTNVQAILERAVKSSTAAISFAAESGKTYYLTKTPEQTNSSEGIKLVPVDPAEAQVLMAVTAFSTFRIKQ